MKAKIVKRIKRPSKEWIEKYKTIPASILSDCLNRYYAMSGELRPIYEGIRLCGPAVTIQSMSGNNLMSHVALTLAEAGDVLVIDGRGNVANAIWGSVQAVYAMKKKIAGLVVDGAIRDVENMREMKFPVFCKGVTPAGPHKGWADNVNLPVQCAGIPVMPGDLIVGDDDGVVVVPQDHLKEVYNEAMKRIDDENEWLKRIEKGESSLDAVGLRNILDKMDISYEE